MADQVQDTDADVAQDAPTADVLDTPAPIDESKTAELLAQKRKANREAQAAKADLQAALAKLQEYEERDKTELQKAQDRAKKLEEQLQQTERTAQYERRRNIALANRIEQQYAGYVAEELAKAQDAEAELDVEGWFKDLKKRCPAFFLGNGGPAPASSEGGPSSGQPSKVAELDAIRAKITELVRSGRGDDRKEQEIWKLSAQAERLTKEINK